MIEKTPMVLVDDDPIFGELWTSSCPSSVDLHWVSDPKQLYSQSFFGKLIPETQFYVDCELGGGFRGEDVCRHLFDLGFENIFISTCHNQEKFHGVAFLKGVRDKMPPWLD